MQQPEPVADLVHGRFTLVVTGNVALWHRSCEHIAAVKAVVGHWKFLQWTTLAGRVCDICRQCAVAEKLLGSAVGSGAKVGLKIYVEGRVITLPKSILHVCVSVVGCPGVVDCTVHADKIQCYVCACISTLQGAELAGYHGSGDHVSSVRGAHDVKPCIDSEFGSLG